MQCLNHPLRELLSYSLNMFDFGRILNELISLGGFVYVCVCPLGV